MKHIRFYFASKKVQMAQLHDLSRRLQEAWDECDTLGDHLVDSWDKEECLRDQLLLVARERDQEREGRLGAYEVCHDAMNQIAAERSLRLEAEDRLLDRYLEAPVDQSAELAQLAEELRDTYLEALEHKEE